jgi:primase-like protein/bifunctional DNA primase/polymerase-like protein
MCAYTERVVVAEACPSRPATVRTSTPATAEVATGSGGRHLYFHGVIAKGRLADGVDLQGEGSFVVAPPSRHASGRRYEWDGGPGKSAPVGLPGWVSIRTTTGARVAEPLPEGPIPAGRRNAVLTSLAGSMRRRGSSEEAILAALRVENRRCDPPLEDSELVKIAGSIARYAPTGTVALSPASPSSALSTSITLAGLHRKFEEHLYLPDLVAVDVAAAAVIAHRTDGDPLWMFFVSPPSAGKTEIVSSVGGCPEVYRLSSLTGQTFVSGFKGRNSSLLSRLDDAGVRWPDRGFR